MGTEAVCADEIIMNEEATMCLDRKDEVWIGPATPEEDGEHHHHHHHDDDLSSPLSETETPKGSLFDSFAPASDKFLLAPYRKKYREESRDHVVRRLDFDFTATISNDNDVSVEEEEKEEEKRLFEIVYSTIMDAILAEQAKQEPEPEQEQEQASTPKSAPLLTGVAETCPEAPIKSARKQRSSIIDKEICRKLQF